MAVKRLSRSSMKICLQAQIDHREKCVHFGAVDATLEGALDNDSSNAFNGDSSQVQFCFFFLLNSRSYIFLPVLYCCCHCGFTKCGVEIDYCSFPLFTPKNGNGLKKSLVCWLQA